MNSFEQVCDECTVRELVDPARAIERPVEGEPNVMELDDGFRQCRVTVRPNGTGTAVSIEDRAGTLIDSVCKGAGETALKRTCGVDFVSTWKLERKKPTPNIAVASDVLGLLQQEKYRTHALEMAFNVVDVRRTTGPIIGSQGAVGSNRKVYLEAPSYTLRTEFPDIFVIGIGGGPEYAFNFDANQPTDFMFNDAALAYGLFEFLNTDEQGLVRSQQKIEAMHAIFQTGRKELQDFVLNGGLHRELQRNDE